MGSNAHAEAACVAAADAWKLFQGNATDNRPLMQGHQLHDPLIVRLHAFLPSLGGWKRHLQRLTGDDRFVVKRGDARDVGMIEAFEGYDSVGAGHG
ncbi:hypothetical protein D3C76_1132430 [compost metagenome]